MKPHEIKQGLNVGNAQYYTCTDCQWCIAITPDGKRKRISHGDFYVMHRYMMPGMALNVNTRA